MTTEQQPDAPDFDGGPYDGPTDPEGVGEQQPADQGRGVGESAECISVLERLKEALPTVGLNGWTSGVAALEWAIAALTQPKGDDGLDFEPDEQHTVSDMANVGYSLMQAIKRNLPDYTYSDSPAEIVSDLLNERDEALAALSLPRPSIPEIGRWTMAKGSDGQRWSVYMDRDDRGEWCKWSEVQQKWCLSSLPRQSEAAKPIFGWWREDGFVLDEYFGLGDMLTQGYKPLVLQCADCEYNPGLCDTHDAAPPDTTPAAHGVGEE